MDFNNDFDKKMLMAACNFSVLSKDFSTKVGFMLLRNFQKSPSIFSYNGLVRGSNDSCETRAKTRPEKYLWGEHAERNGLYDTAKEYLKDTMIFCAKFPNMDSARAIVITGINLVVTDFDSSLHDEYMKFIKNKNKDAIFSDEVLMYHRVLQFFRENGVQIYHPSRKLAKEGSFLYASDNSGNRTNETGENRFLRKSIEILDQTIAYAKLFSRREYKDAAIILRKNTFASVSMGAHNVPEGYDEFMTTEKDSEKENGRSFWYIEAVKDAIYNVLRPSLENSTAYVSWCPCMDCAMALYSVGVKKIVTKKPMFNTEAELRWKEHFVRTEKFFNDVNMNAIFFNETDLI